MSENLETLAAQVRSLSPIDKLILAASLLRAGRNNQRKTALRVIEMARDELALADLLRPPIPPPTKGTP